jgi:hypothetical protein
MERGEVTRDVQEIENVLSVKIRNTPNKIGGNFEYKIFSNKNTC